MNTHPEIIEGHEIENGQSTLNADSGMVALLNKSEIDQQIVTAHRFPRSLTKFRQTTQEMVTLTESIARECIYALPRDKKVIEGPSARFAEIILSAWGNARAGARVVDIGPEFVTSQGAFHDLERNVAITFEVQRRITDSKGRRYSGDMIGVTSNAASSIALRNAILKGIPKAFWNDMYAAARKVVAGDVRTLVDRRAKMLQEFQIFGVKPDQIFALLEVKGVEDITIEHLVVLAGVHTAIKDGDTTPEEAFGIRPKEDPKTNGKTLATFADNPGGEKRDAPPQQAEAAKPQAAAEQKANDADAPKPAAAEAKPAAAEKTPAKEDDKSAADADRALFAKKVDEGKAITTMSKFDALDDQVCRWLDGIGREDLRGEWNTFYQARSAELKTKK